MLSCCFDLAIIGSKSWIRSSSTWDLPPPNFLFPRRRSRRSISTSEQCAPTRKTSNGRSISAARCLRPGHLCFEVEGSLDQRFSIRSLEEMQIALFDPAVNLAPVAIAGGGGFLGGDHFDVLAVNPA